MERRERWLSLAIFFFFYWNFRGRYDFGWNHICPCVGLSISRQPLCPLNNLPQQHPLMWMFLHSTGLKVSSNLTDGASANLPDNTKKISGSITTWRTLSSRMSIITSAMTEGNCAISGQKAKSRTAILRQWKYTAVRTAAAVSINPNVFTDTMRKRIQTAIKSWRSMNGGKN